MTDDELLKKLQAWHSEAVRGHDPSFAVAEKCSAFYQGEQWDETVRQTLKAQGRPALTINRILPTINSLCGIERQNRKDIKVFPKRRGTGTVANVLTALLTHSMDLSNGEWEKSEAFKDGLIHRRGWLYIDLVPGDYDRWDVQIERLSPGSVLEDPLGRKYDLNADSGHVIIERWMDKDEIEARWGVGPAEESEETFWARLRRVGTDVAGYLTGETVDTRSIVEAGRKKRQGRVLDFWWKETKEGVWLSREDDRIRLTKPADIKRAKEAAAANPESLDVSEPMSFKVLHVCRVLGKEILDHTEDPFDGVSLFPVVRFTPLFDDGECMSMVEFLLSPQEEKNKRRSQALHQLNTTANSGWMYDSKALTPLQEEHLEDHGSGAGVIVKYSEGHKPERIAPMPLSEGHVKLAELADRDMNDISGVNRELLGYGAKGGTSGKALQLQQRQGLVTTLIMFDYWDMACQIFAQTLMEITTSMEVYSDEEIRALVDREDLVDHELLKRAGESLAKSGVTPPQMPQPPDPTALAGLLPEDQAGVMQAFAERRQQAQQGMQAYQEQVRQAAEAMLFEELRSMKVGKYGIRVLQAANSPTLRAAHFATLAEIARMYPGAIPPDVFIGATDHPAKEEIISKLQAVQGPPQPAGKGGERPLVQEGVA